MGCAKHKQLDTIDNPVLYQREGRISVNSCQEGKLVSARFSLDQEDLTVVHDNGRNQRPYLVFEKDPDDYIASHATLHLRRGEAVPFYRPLVGEAGARAARAYWYAQWYPCPREQWKD